MRAGESRCRLSVLLFRAEAVWHGGEEGQKSVRWESSPGGDENWIPGGDGDPFSLRGGKDPRQPATRHWCPGARDRWRGHRATCRERWDKWSRRDGSLTFNIRGECQTGPAARGGWRSDAGAWSKVPERPARSGHGTGHVVSPRKLDEFGPHPNPLPPEAGGRGGKTGTGPRSRDGRRLAASAGLGTHRGTGHVVSPRKCRRI